MSDGSSANDSGASQGQQAPGPRALPPGLDAAGQATGTLAVVVPAGTASNPASSATPGAQAAVSAAYIDADGICRHLTQAQTDTLLAHLDAGRTLRHQEVDLLALAADAVADAQVSRRDHIWELDLSDLLSPPHTQAPGLAPEDVTDPAEEPVEDPAEDPGLPVVLGDEARLRQVMANLLTNAAVHTPAGTHVTVRLRHEPGPQPTWIMEVSDNGPGIAPDLRERVFERFVRGDESRERTNGCGSAASSPPSSTGLGTSIALAIVRSHGGTLTVTSTTREELAAGSAGQEYTADRSPAPATGTTFTVRLPAA